MKKAARLLIVDDEMDILIALELYLSRYFRQVDTETDPNKLPELLATQSYDIVLLDMNFSPGATSGAEGLHWLEKILFFQAQTTVLMMTAYAEIDMAVAALKRGATDFIEKPWRNEKLLATLTSAYELSLNKRTVRQLKQQSESLNTEIGRKYGEIIGESPAMQQVFSVIDKVAKTDANVLILGENGTGKELVARAIHRQSNRNAAIFVSVDLGAVPATLFESELFGHKKGAFTDAHEDRTGQFEAAAGGTLFLDEIGNLTPPLQAKLLSALQNRKIRRVGSNQWIEVDLRLICATNMPLYEMVHENRFRQDLLYRVNTVEVQLPPLRDRREDIPLLIHHFLEVYAQKYQKGKRKIGAQTMKRLQSYSWQGNIRELRHAVERAVILSDKEKLEAADFFLQPDRKSQQGQGAFDSFHLPSIEKWAIESALKKHQGNISKAADELGLTRAALYRRIEKHGL